MKQPEVVYCIINPYDRLEFVTTNRRVAARAIRILSERGTYTIKHMKCLSSRSVEKLLNWGQI